jgi:hypothetical protein
MKILAILLAVLSAHPALAQDKGGNGGGYTLIFKHFRNSIVRWVEENQKAGTLDSKLKLSENGIEPAAFVSKLQAAVVAVGNHFDIRPGQVMIGPRQDVPRPCGNFNDNSIKCSEEEWVKAVQMRFSGYLLSLVLHEYLGIAKIEENEGKDSTYPISPQLIPYADEILRLPSRQTEGAEADVCSGRIFINPELDAADVESIRDVFSKKGYSFTLREEEATHLLDFKIDYFDGIVDKWHVASIQVSVFDLHGNRVINLRSEPNFSNWRSDRELNLRILRKSLRQCDKETGRHQTR